MAKINWNRPKFVYDGIRAYEPIKKSKIIEGHDGHIFTSTLATGPHYCKITCDTCNGKFIKWGTKEDHLKHK